MKQFTILLAITFAFLVLASPRAEAQWTQMTGPFGGTIYCITAVPNGSSGSILFAGTAGSGIFRSYNSGASWTACNSGLTNQSHTVRAIAVSGSNLFAGVYESGVFVSNDNGANWTAVNSGLTDLRVFTVVVFGTKLFAGTYGGGVFFSDNNGANWTAVNTGLGSLNIQTLAVHGTDLYAGTTSASVYRFRQSRKGDSWQQFSKGMSSSNTVYELTSLGADLFAGTMDGVYRSVNGKPWSLRNTGIPTYINGQGFARIGTTTFVATNGGVFLSANSGNSWTAANTGLTSTWLRSLLSDGSTLYAGANLGGGVFISQNLGTSWTASNTGMNANNITAITMSGTNLIVGATNGFYYSANNGATWTSAGLTQRATAFVSNAAGLFAGTLHDGVYFSNDNGVSWTARRNGMTQSQVNAIAAIGSYLFAGTNYDLYVSANNGVNWNRVNMPGRSITSFAVIGNSIFAGLNRGNGVPTTEGVIRSDDNGVTWTVVNPGWTGYIEIGDIVAIGTDLYAAANTGVFVTTDKGTSWTKVSTTGIGSFAVSGTNLFGSNGNGVFVSSTGGTSWTNVSVGLTNTSIYPLTIIGTDLLAGSFGAGLWIRPLAQMPKPSWRESLPTGMTLHQNYPNPFNPSTTITYSISEDGPAELRVFDSYGRVVAELEKGIMAAGTHRIEFDARSLPSGVYHYRLTTKARSLTRTMILMK